MEKLELDIDMLETGYPITRVVTTFSWGKVRNESWWDRERLAMTLDYLEKNVDAKGKCVMHRGMIPMWAYHACHNVLQPAQSFHYTVYLQRDVEIIAPAIGAVDPRGAVEFIHQQEGEDYFLRVVCDDPKIEGHNYDADKFPYVKADAIPHVKNLFLKVEGATCFGMAFAQTYQPYCDNLFLWAYRDNVPKQMDVDGTVYGCAYSKYGEYELGKKVERPR